jgi:hypothetical protein
MALGLRRRTSAIREVQLLQSIEAAAAKAIDARYDDIDPA